MGYSLLIFIIVRCESFSVSQMRDLRLTETEVINLVNGEHRTQIQVLYLQVQGRWPHPLNTSPKVSRSDSYFFTEHDLHSTTSVFPCANPSA